MPTGLLSNALLLLRGVTQYCVIGLDIAKYCLIGLDIAKSKGKDLIY